MIRRAYSRTLSHAGLAAGLLVLTAPALAKDATYCVTCKNPDQVYSCQVTGVGSRANDAVKLYCIIRTAKEGNHASCSAERGAKDCQGLTKVYNYDGPAIPPEVASDPRVQGLVDRIARDQDAFDKPKEGKGPKTMFELGGRAVSASRQGLRNARSRLGGSSEADEPVPLTSAPPPPAESLPAVERPPIAETLPAVSEDVDRPNRVQRAGTAVGGFARKSYRCMTSLFRKCRDETADGQALQ
ncbi:MAG: hypothetical protein WD852_05400 [Methyloceanibacter sp.]